MLWVQPTLVAREPRDEQLLLEIGFILEVCLAAKYEESYFQLEKGEGEGLWGCVLYRKTIICCFGCMPEKEDSQEIGLCIEKKIERRE